VLFKSFHLEIIGALLRRSYIRIYPPDVPASTVVEDTLANNNEVTLALPMSVRCKRESRPYIPRMFTMRVAFVVCTLWFMCEVKTTLSSLMRNWTQLIDLFIPHHQSSNDIREPTSFIDISSVSVMRKTASTSLRCGRSSHCGKSDIPM